MRLIERMRKRIAANLNEMIARARDPERALNQLVAEIDDDLEMATQTAMVAEGQERRLRDELADHELPAKVMEKKALLATERGDNELAREALKRRRMQQRLADDIRSGMLEKLPGIGTQTGSSDDRNVADTPAEHSGEPAQ